MRFARGRVEATGFARSAVITLLVLDGPGTSDMAPSLEAGAVAWLASLQATPCGCSGHIVALAHRFSALLTLLGRRCVSERAQIEYAELQGHGGVVRIKRCSNGEVPPSAREGGFLDRKLRQSKVSALQQGVQLDRTGEFELRLGQLLALQVDLPQVLMASAVRRSQGDRLSQLVDRPGRVVQAAVTKRQQRVDDGRLRVLAAELLE